MNLFRFCERYGISFAKARRMEKDGLLRFDPDGADILAIREKLARGKPLSAELFCVLIENPALLPDLGRMGGRVNSMLEALGNVREEAAPIAVSAFVGEAAKNDEDAVNVLLAWLRGIIPARAVPHAYIATRLLLGMAPTIRTADAPRIPRALLNCRRRASFAPYWRIEKKITIYQKPLAGFDL